MPTQNPEYTKFAGALHAALLTSPATKAACATHMITTGGLALSQGVVEAAIDISIADLFSILILPTQDYAALLARHQSADPAAALRVLETTGTIAAHEQSAAEWSAASAAATAEWTALTQPQKDAIPNIFAAGLEGIAAFDDAALAALTIASFLRDRRGL